MDSPVPTDAKYRSFLELERMTVHELRHYARELPAFPLAGREISRGGRSLLLQMIKTHIEHLETEAAVVHIPTRILSDEAKS